MYDIESIWHHTFYNELRVEPQKYELPHGQVITIDKELCTCCEMLFDPRLKGKDNASGGIDSLIYTAIEKCDVDIQPELYKKIVYQVVYTVQKYWRKIKRCNFMFSEPLLACCVIRLGIMFWLNYQYFWH